MQLSFFANTSDPVSSKVEYDIFNAILSDLREKFHRTGRFDDSNAKLDEITKLIAIRLHEAKSGTHRFSLEWLRQRAEQAGYPGNVARALRELAEEVLKSEEYRNPDGTSIFGASPTLNIQPTDDAFAEAIVRAVLSLPWPNTDAALTELDLLNEAFGHFVRDNFRNHKEDAQYMTPPEVVDFMLDLAFSDLNRSEVVERVLSGKKPFLIMDPTCGVGSFLVGALKRLYNVAKTSGFPEADVQKLVRQYLSKSLIGQDKVDRMVRLAKLNLMMFGANPELISQGNSLLGESMLDRYLGQVDLILSNPPFGATISLADLAKTPGFAERYPMLSSWYQNGFTKTVDSELAVLDRSLALLKPGGKLLIIVPDKVVSSSGVYASARKWLQSSTILRAVVELPAVTFAQAGTRTKTCVVYLEKPENDGVLAPKTFVSVCRDLGFVVNERGGVPVKQIEGTNELVSIAARYKEGAETDDIYEIVQEEPPCVWVRHKGLINGRWTPNFYQPKRILALHRLSRLDPNCFEIRPLRDVADLVSRERRLSSVEAARVPCISVLHIRDDGTVNLREVQSNLPKTPGLACYPGEVLFSKINPRIPRVCVVPEVRHRLSCSTEFEILRPREGFDPYVLASVLLSPIVQDQIQCLTAGTSSSHSRIKASELALVQIPIPKPKTSVAEQFWRLGLIMREAVEAKYRGDMALQEARSQLARILEGDCSCP